jgi:hypothetical protein
MPGILPPPSSQVDPFSPCHALPNHSKIGNQQLAYNFPLLFKVEVIIPHLFHAGVLSSFSTKSIRFPLAPPRRIQVKWGIIIGVQLFVAD